MKMPEREASTPHSRRDYFGAGWRLFYAFVLTCLIFDAMALKVILHG